MKVEKIRSDIGVLVSPDSKEELFETTIDEWQKLLYENLVIIIDKTKLSYDEFNSFSKVFGRPWTEKEHGIHFEPIDENGINHWGTKNATGLRSLSWHTDNSWHPTLRKPIRILNGAKIFDPDSAVVHFLNTGYLFNHQFSEKERRDLMNLRIVVWDYKNKNACYPYPLVCQNPHTKELALDLSAMDINRDILGLKKEADYIKGNTFIIDLIDQYGKSVGLELLADYIEESMNHEECYFSQRWSPGLMMVLSNTNSMHMRERVTEQDRDRLLWRRTLSHYFQDQLS
jgi:alpha-ketoglutarate-dependent taurine dioxygenase